MGWKGTVRSVKAAYRAAERDKKRYQKELEREERQYQKELELSKNRDEFEDFQEYCASLISFHGYISKKINWNKILNSKKPSKPRKLSKNEKCSNEKLKNYKPSLFDKLFKREEKKISTLKKMIGEAIEKDINEYNQKIKEWESAHQQWELNVNLANKINSDDFQSKLDVLNSYFDTQLLDNYKINIDFQREKNEVRIIIYSAGIEIIPTHTKSLLQSGKVSIKKMPLSKHFELYQDHVCSIALKCAGEFFALISDEKVFVDVMDEMLNKKTGHKNIAPILSICFSKTTFEELNLKRVDPSDCITNFVHNMNFKKTKGFQEVEIIKI